MFQHFMRFPRHRSVVHPKKKTSGSQATTGSAENFILFHCPLDGKQFNITAGIRIDLPPKGIAALMILSCDLDSHLTGNLDFK